MGKITRSSIHKAGHAVASVVLGQQLKSVYIGPIWQSEPGSNFVSFKAPAVDGRVVRDSDTPVRCVPTIKGAGRAAEILWEISLAPEEEKHKLRERLLQEAAANPRYRSDLAGAKNPRLWIKKAGKLLRRHWLPLVHTARYLNAHQNTTIPHETIAEICDRWPEL